MGTLLAKIVIPKMFDFIQAPVALGEGLYKDDNIYAHYCTACEQTFTARWGYTRFNGWQSWDGNFFSCPGCRGSSEHKGLVHDIGVGVPEKMILSLYEYKNHISLRISYTEVSFDDIRFCAIQKSCHETVIFDVRKMKSYFETKDAVRYEISNPEEREFGEHSALKYLTHNSTAWKENKKDFANLMLKLRTAISNKVKSLHGIRIKAMHVPAGNSMGALLFPLSNIAWRLAVPDAPNLPTAFNDRSWRSDYRGFVKAHYMDKTALESFLESVISGVRAGKSYPQSVLSAMGIKDTKAFRKIIAKGSILEAGRLKTAICVSSDYKEQLLLTGALASCGGALKSSGMQIEPIYAHSEQNLNFLKLVADHYKNNAAYYMLKNCESGDITDCGQMYFKLIPETQNLLWAEKPSITQIHDWLVEKWDAQKNKDYSLQIPEHVVKRMAMQKDRLKFFLPGTAHELRMVGQKLHNCVGSYAERALAGTCTIVTMTNDEGKLLVCIEVAGGEIRQAKLNQNRPVARNPELNAAVVEWAKDAKLKINTLDIDSRSSDKELRNAI